MMGVPDSLENLRGRKLTEDVVATDGQIMIPRGRNVTVTLMRNALARGCDLSEVVVKPKGLAPAWLLTKLMAERVTPGSSKPEKQKNPT
tara:strand:- start:1221 stop:1487 length:267 start_codon:yes stop_codon:yes gene_type:complete